MPIIWKKEAHPKEIIDKMVLNYKASLNSDGFLKLYVYNKLNIFHSEGELSGEIDLTKVDNRLVYEQNFSSSLLYFTINHSSKPLEYDIALDKREINETIFTTKTGAFELGNKTDEGYLLPSYLTVCFSTYKDNEYLRNGIKRFKSSQFIDIDHTTKECKVNNNVEHYFILNAVLRIHNNRLIIYPRKKNHSLQASLKHPIIVPIQKISSVEKTEDNYVILDVLWMHENIQYNHLLIPVYYEEDESKILNLKASKSKTEIEKIFVEAGGIINDNQYRKNELEIHFSPSLMEILDYKSGETITQASLNDNELWILADEDRLSFAKDNDFLVCHSKNGDFGSIISGKIHQVISNTIAKLSPGSSGEIYICRLGESEGAYPAVLHIDQNFLYEKTIEETKAIPLSSIQDFEIKYKDNYHHINLITDKDNEYILDQRVSAGLIYNMCYEKYKNHLIEYDLKTYYKTWGKQLNEYILYNIFGDIIKANHSIKYHDSLPYKKSEERELYKIITLYAEIQAIKNKLEYLSLYLPSFLNTYDENWLKSQVSLSKTKNQIIGSTFDDLGRRINLVINNLLRYVSEIERALSRMEIVLQKLEMTFWDRLKEIEITRAINPYYLVTQAPNIAAGIVPSIIKDESVKKVKSYGPKALHRFENLHKVYLSPLIIEANKTAYQTISDIISRDLKLFEHSPNADQIKEEVFKRYLKLHTFCSMPLETEFDLVIADIVRELFEKARNIDYASLPIIE